MKKRLLITACGLRVGGVERSLLGLLGALDRDRFDITLHLWAHDGELMKEIPQDICLLLEDTKYASLLGPLREVLLSPAFPVALARLTAKFITWARAALMRKKGFLLLRSVRYSLPFLPSIGGRYDLAISFLTPHDPVLKKVTASKKVGWIHTDYSTMECGVDHEFELPVWEGLDAIAAVSESVKENFLTVFPEVEEKVVVIENIISPEFIRRQAGVEDVAEEMPAVPGEVRVCSVGRFCHAKNFDSIPAIVGKLNKIGIDVRWYLIGFGIDEPLIRQRINESGVENQVIILGKKTNPYPYMKACDIYVQPSRYEGKAVTVREAQILEKPVLITDFPTAKSQLENGVDGLICPLSIEGVVDGVSKLVASKELSEKFTLTAAVRDYSNRKEIEKIEQLFL